MIKKLVVSSLMVTGLLLGSAASPAAAAGDVDLAGRWTAADQADGSTQSLVFAGGDLRLLMVYADEFAAEACDGGELLMAGRGSVFGDTVRGTVSGVCDNGTRVGPMAVELRYDSKREVLVDRSGTVWTNIFH